MCTALEACAATKGVPRVYPPCGLWGAVAAEAVTISAQLGKSKGCALKHDLSLYKGQGQTLAGGAKNINPKTTNTQVVNAWIKEGARYNYSRLDRGAGGCRTGKWKDCGHYLQVGPTAQGTGVQGCAVGCAIG